MSSIEPILRVQRVLWAALAFAPASYAIISRVAAPIAKLVIEQALQPMPEPPATTTGTTTTTAGN